MKTVTICGSMRFAREMRRAAFLLESRQGCNVLQCTYPEPGDTVTPEMRQRLEEAHLEKIRISDLIYVVDVGGYIGQSVGQEIAYARQLGKPVVFDSQTPPGTPL